MRIFALETDLEKAKRAFLSESESELFTIRYHPMRFYFRLIRQTLMSLFLLALSIGALELQIPPLLVTILSLAVFLFFILPGLITAFIDWKFDAVVVTSDKVIIIDQTSIFHVEVRQMYLENFASVNAATQFWNIFSFGMLCFDLKEGIGKRLNLPFVPKAPMLALKISDCVRTYQQKHHTTPPIQKVS